MFMVTFFFRFYGIMIFYVVLQTLIQEFGQIKSHALRITNSDILPRPSVSLPEKRWDTGVACSNKREIRDVLRFPW